MLLWEKWDISGFTYSCRVKVRHSDQPYFSKPSNDFIAITSSILAGTSVVFRREYYVHPSTHSILTPLCKTFTGFFDPLHRWPLDHFSYVSSSFPSHSFKLATNLFKYYTEDYPIPWQSTHFHNVRHTHPHGLTESEHFSKHLVLSNSHLRNATITWPRRVNVPWQSTQLVKSLQTTLGQWR